LGIFLLGVLLAKFAGILSDDEAADLQEAIQTDCRQVDLNQW
jgi:hypothetical protein